MRSFCYKFVSSFLRIYTWSYFSWRLKFFSRKDLFCSYNWDLAVEICRNLLMNSSSFEDSIVGNSFAVSESMFFCMRLVFYLISKWVLTIYFYLSRDSLASSLLDRVKFLFSSQTSSYFLFTISSFLLLYSIYNANRPSSDLLIFSDWSYFTIS